MTVFPTSPAPERVLSEMPSSLYNHESSVCLHLGRPWQYAQEDLDKHPLENVTAPAHPLPPTNVPPIAMQFTDEVGCGVGVSGVGGVGGVGVLVFWCVGMMVCWCWCWCCWWHLTAPQICTPFFVVTPAPFSFDSPPAPVLFILLICWLVDRWVGAWVGGSVLGAHPN